MLGERRRSIAVVLGSWLLDRELCGIQRRRDARACRSVPSAREAALRDADNVLKHAREINHAASLMFTLSIALTRILCGNYAAAKTQSDEVVVLADEKGALFWNAFGAMNRSWSLALTGGASDAVHAFQKQSPLGGQPEQQCLCHFTYHV
jgi:hypothetical protein